MVPRAALLVPVTLTALLALGGCAITPSQSIPPGDGGDTGASAPAQSVQFGCETKSEQVEVVLGEIVTVWRGPDGACEGLEPGTTQTFRLGPEITAADFEVPVAGDGSFSFDLTVPDDMMIGSASLGWVPTDDVCDQAGVLDCQPPHVGFRVGYPPGSLQELTVLSTVIADMPLPQGAYPAYALPGPTSDQLIIVLWGSGCPRIPSHYVATAPPDSLELVSGVEPGTEGRLCTEQLQPWASVIEIPDRFEFTTVKVDNVSTGQSAAPAGG